MSLPAYRSCDYSLFVSYAHDDDEGNNNWVTALQVSISRRLRTLKTKIPQLGLHLSGLNGPRGGTLGEELEQRVRKSFGMLIVVGKKYADSDWCEEELEFFERNFGKDGFKKRLFVVAMSKAAMDRVCNADSWKRLVPTDQIWVPFYQRDRPVLPIDPGQVGNNFASQFWEQSSVLADVLIEEIEGSWQQGLLEDRATIVQTAGDGPNRANGNGKSQPTPIARELRVLIGAFTPDLNDAVDDLRKRMEVTENLSVSLLNRDRVSQWEEEGQLAADLRAFDFLVVPFSDAQPLNPKALVGGHLAIQQVEWARLAKPARILWYRPSLAQDTETPKMSKAHQLVASALSPVYASYEALESAMLDKPEGAPRVILYIEKNPSETTLWKPLGRRMTEVWEELNNEEKGQSIGLDIRARPLDIEKLNKSKSQEVDDADGVILLFGEKHPKSLHEQINLVEDAIPYHETFFPGVVALLVPRRNPEERIAENYWEFVKFNTEDPKGVRELEPDTEKVREFLREIRDRRKLRTAKNPPYPRVSSPVKREDVAGG